VQKLRHDWFCSAGALAPAVFHESPITKHESHNIAEELIVPPTFDWDAIEDIAIALSDKFPETDPLTVRFTDMHKWITELSGFSGDPQKSNESKLEAIQMAWHEEFQDRQKQ
jgi:FeS assembly protein IscX